MMALPPMKSHSRKAAALGFAAALCLCASGGFARAAPHVVCTGTPPQYNPADLNYKRTSVSAASRLALAIRWREYLATCHRLAPHLRHPS